MSAFERTHVKIASRIISNGWFTVVVAFETLSTWNCVVQDVVQTCWEQIGQDIIDHAIA